MVIWLYPTTSKARPQTAISLLLLSILMCTCKSQSDPYDELSDGQISYPFTDKTEKIGRDPAKNDHFVIRSVRGQSEYIVEIPDGGDDYDIMVPMQGLPGGGGEAKKDPKNPQITDRELISAMPKPDASQERDRAMLEDALGVGATEGSEEGPSYSLGLAKVMEYYKTKQFEYALIEINQLLSFYPNAARLYKMKGTILLKTGELDLAERAWTRAVELDPKDKAISRGLERMRKRKEVKADPAKKESRRTRRWNPNF